MPFRKGFNNIENRNTDQVTIYYQINYIRRPVAKNAAYFHARSAALIPIPICRISPCWMESKARLVCGHLYDMGVHNNGWWAKAK